MATDGDVLSSAAAGPAVVRGGALRLLGFVTTSLLALVSGAVLYRHLGTVGTGHYTSAMQLVALVAGASDLGLTAIGLRELSVRRGAQRESMARAMLGLRLAVTVLGVVTVTLFALVAYGSTLGLGVMLAGIGLLFQVWQGTLAIPLMTELRFGWTSLFEVARQLITSLLIVVLVVAGAGLLAFLATPIPAAIVVLALMIVRFRRQLPMGLRFDTGAWRELVKPVLAYALAVAASALYFRVALVLLSLLSNGHQLGYFSVSFNIVAALFSIPALLVSAAFPIFSRAARDDDERLGYAVERVFEVSLIAGAWMSLEIALGAGFAVEVVGGHDFIPAVPVLAIQGISVGATFIGTVAGFGLLSLSRHRTILLFNIGALAAIVLAVSVLAPLDGARGAAIAASAVELALAIASWRVLIHARSSLRPSLRGVPKVAVATALAALPLLLPVSEPARVAVSTVVYVAALMILRAFPTELTALLPGSGHARRAA
ncbi:MAG: oligosaccharide flippase family protein [Solirubrobacteraceae bacterium]